MAKGRKLNVNESYITVINQNETDYISLIDNQIEYVGIPYNLFQRR